MLHRRTCTRRLDQCLNYLGHLRQWLRLTQKSVGPCVASFLLGLRRSIRREYHNACVGIALVNELDDVETFRTSFYSETQILNDDFVIRLFNEYFRLFLLARCVHLESVLGEILAHRKTDRLFVIDDE